MSRPVGRPRLCGGEAGVRASIMVPKWVREELGRSGGVSTTAREVLERWARRNGASGPSARSTAIQAAVEAVDRADQSLQHAQKALAAARKSLERWLPDAGEP